MDLYQIKGWNRYSIKGKAEQCTREARIEAANNGTGSILTPSNNYGCNVNGYVLVHKVAGNLHVAVGRGTTDYRGQHIHQYDPKVGGKFNASHTIHSLIIGDEQTPYQLSPLSNVQQISEAGGPALAFYYNLRIIPTTLLAADRKTQVNTYQYSQMNEVRKVINEVGKVRGLPGFFLNYEFSPFMVKVNENTVPFLQFITGLCAIIGGVFTIAGVLDSLLYALVGDHEKSTPKGIGSYLG